MTVKEALTTLRSRLGWGALSVTSLFVVALMAAGALFGFEHIITSDPKWWKCGVVFFVLWVGLFLCATHRWGALSVTSLFVVALTAAGALFGFEHIITSDPKWWKCGVVFFVFWVGLFLYATHTWSVAVVSGLTAKLAKHPLDSSKWDPGKCEHCGEAALFVCPKCDSIQWRKLQELKVSSGSTENIGLANFVTHYRWKLLGSFLPVVVVGAVAFATQLQLQLWKNQEDKDKQDKDQAAQVRLQAEEQAREVVNSMIDYRKGMVELVAFCRDKMSTSSCEERFERTHAAYTRLSWYGGLVASRAMNGPCREPHLAGTPHDYGCEFFRRLYEDVDNKPDLDVTFREFANAYFNAAAIDAAESSDAGAPSSDPRAQLEAHHQVCAKAKRFYYEGRTWGCAILGAWFSPSNPPPELAREPSCLHTLQNAHDNKRDVIHDLSPFEWNRFGCTDQDPPHSDRAPRAGR